MKYLTASLVTVTAATLLFVALPAISGGPPDPIHSWCVDPANREDLRAIRNKCDDAATYSGYNAGIFRPANSQDQDDGMMIQICMEPAELYVCLGAPGTTQ
jgi:hypothetical protein